MGYNRSPMIAVAFLAALLSNVAIASPVIRNDALASSASTPHCRYLPGDSGWPKQSTWSQLNRTVGGRLISGTPLAHACYGSDLSASALAQCSQLQEEWTTLGPFLNDPISVMSPYWMNRSCSPFEGPSGSCGLGNLPSFAINVTGAEDVIADDLHSQFS
ncbi:hypothetical protein O1611_g8986 [Lasiodiplodia mahajangana]|uniref:Uncharacterized protein n=1 Tax=Lasiodiplodia mahajangana TaxID=1108764 RepID=A0ACC2JAX9_9PEZI|nr:hypothetical protein O1611_g8986 [Lasiodiplodia mahajangana]